MELLLPDVSYQCCQYHYLKDMAKPVVDLDRKFKTRLKKSRRGIRNIERKIERPIHRQPQGLYRGRSLLSLVLRYYYFS